jgi:hypothetical protein
MDGRSAKAEGERGDVNLQGEERNRTCPPASPRGHSNGAEMRRGQNDCQKELKIERNSWKPTEIHGARQIVSRKFGNPCGFFLTG